MVGKYQITFLGKTEYFKTVKAMKERLDIIKNKWDSFSEDERTGYFGMLDIGAFSYSATRERRICPNGKGKEKRHLYEVVENHNIGCEMLGVPWSLKCKRCPAEKDVSREQSIKLGLEVTDGWSPIIDKSYQNMDEAL